MIVTITGRLGVTVVVVRVRLVVTRVGRLGWSVETSVTAKATSSVSPVVNFPLVIRPPPCSLGRCRGG